MIAGCAGCVYYIYFLLDRKTRKEICCPLRRRREYPIDAATGWYIKESKRHPGRHYFQDPKTGAKTWHRANMGKAIHTQDAGASSAPVNHVDMQESPTK